MIARLVISTSVDLQVGTKGIGDIADEIVASMVVGGGRDLRHAMVDRNLDGFVCIESEWLLRCS